jgi:hypothetical protein
MPRLSPEKITVEIQPSGALVTVTGRNAWMLKNLMDVGPKGLTSIERPAPRISYYVSQLREVGLDIVTDYEEHAGPYPGRHGRYRLLSEVRVVDRAGVAA